MMTSGAVGIQRRCRTPSPLPHDQQHICAVESSNLSNTLKSMILTTSLRHQVPEVVGRARITGGCDSRLNENTVIGLARKPTSQRDLPTVGARSTAEEGTRARRTTRLGAYKHGHSLQRVRRRSEGPCRSAGLCDSASERGEQRWMMIE